MEQKQFQAESKRMLDLMIHSIYTHKEIFLRELISNASDAIDKLYFRSLTDEQVGIARDEFHIELKPDKDARTLTIIDNGIGMTAEELEQNLGVIAHSGSRVFKSENTLDDNTDIIGQFGVGFYSAFMVAKTVTVRTKAYGSDTAYEWRSEGVEGYTIDTCDKTSVGTEIILTLLDDTDDEKYSDFLEEYRLRSLVKKYSDYIRFPICMEVTHEHLKEGTEDEYESHTELETLNSRTPIWKKNKNELTDDDYNQFYREKFFDYTKPLLHIHSRSEGMVTYNSLLYIPAKAPYDYYTKEFEKGLQLYASGVMIMEKCADLLPDHFSFVRGIIDSEDLSLNISREMLQHDRQLKLIAKAVEKSIKNELTKLLNTNREQYVEFWKAFGIQLKFGVYNGFGVNKDQLQDLLLFHSSAAEEPDQFTTLAEYVSRMREDQKYIYYVAGESVTRCAALPAAELVRDKGMEVLYLTENVDEFALKMIASYQDKEFKNVSAGDLGLESDEDKSALEEKNNAAKDLFEAMQQALDGKVKAVRLSSRLKNHAVCLTSDGQISLEMEKVLNAMPTNEKVQAERILELNPEHPIFETLQTLLQTDKDKLAQYTQLLYQQALLIEGMSIEDPVAFSKMICALMV
ncbi:MAG: molecular chaperone HtpG [Oscillospiraceae bacterium]|nr:molecular chaperone HtpG [Oscillospiraceae bacterium]